MNFARARSIPTDLQLLVHWLGENDRAPICACGHNQLHHKGLLEPACSYLGGCGCVRFRRVDMNTEKCGCGHHEALHQPVPPQVRGCTECGCAIYQPAEEHGDLVRRLTAA